MKITIEKANEWAKKSCPRFCNSRAMRDFNKTLYLSVVESYIKTPLQKEMTDGTLAGKYWCNSYPWPYCHSEFANWPEFLDSLVTDRCGFIVKHDTSYIAWKLRELTGEWPKKADLIRFTQFDWIQYLADLGYYELARHPRARRKFIGIYPSGSEETAAVWYEVAKPDEKHKDKPVIVTTYLDKEFKILRVNPDNLTWVKIE